MKAIILAGGSGSRLYPLTQVSSKQLQAGFDKPMIYYPLTVLMAAGIWEFCVIATPFDLPRFRQLLGDGTRWGVSIDYREQARPEGIAQIYLIADDFVAGDNMLLMLGDNIFSGDDDFPRAMEEFRIFAYHVKDPQRYGVAEFDREGRAISIEEKPVRPKTAYAVPSIYIYDNQVVGNALAIRPSLRGEFEITDVNREYMHRGQLRVHRLSRGFAWMAVGTTTALQEASAYIEAIERRQGLKIGCPEEAALVRGFLILLQFEALLEEMPNCEYRDCFASAAAEARRLENLQ